MLRTFEAVIEPNGSIRLLEPIELPHAFRAYVTLLDESPTEQDTALLSEPALADDWNRPEEDAAWAHLQSEK